MSQFSYFVWLYIFTFAIICYICFTIASFYAIVFCCIILCRLDLVNKDTYIHTLLKLKNVHIEPKKASATLPWPPWKTFPLVCLFTHWFCSCRGVGFFTLLLLPNRILNLCLIMICSLSNATQLLLAATIYITWISRPMERWDLIGWI